MLRPSGLSRSARQREGRRNYEADGAADGLTEGATDGAAELELGAADGTAEAGAVEAGAAGEAGGLGATDGDPRAGTIPEAHVDHRCVANGRSQVLAD